MNTEQPSLTPEQATQIALERAIKEAFQRTFGGTEESPDPPATRATDAEAPADVRVDGPEATHDQLAPDPGLPGPDERGPGIVEATMTPQDRPGEPVEDVQAVQPVEDLQAVQPVEDLQAVQPVEDLQAVQPVEDLQAVQPVEDLQAVQPVEDLQAVRPVEDVQAVGHVQAVQGGQAALGVTPEGPPRRETGPEADAESRASNAASVSERSRKLVGDFGFRASQHGDAMAVAPRDEIEASRGRFSDARRALLDHIQRLESEVARLNADGSAGSTRGTLPPPAHSTTQRQH